MFISSDAAVKISNVSTVGTPNHSSPAIKAAHCTPTARAAQPGGAKGAESERPNDFVR